MDLNMDKFLKFLCLYYSKFHYGFFFRATHLDGL